MAQLLSKGQGIAGKPTCMLERLLCYQLEQEKERAVDDELWKEGELLDEEIRCLGIKQAKSE